VFCLLPTARAELQQYQIRPEAASRLELRVYKTGIYAGKSHLFVFTDYNGVLQYDPQKPESSTVTLSVGAAGTKLLDTWLSAKDFKTVQQYALKEMLDAAKNPEIGFMSSEVRPSSTGFEVKGTLTIRRVAKPWVVNVSIEPAGEKGGLTFRGDARIRLTDYKLKPPTAALGLVGTKDEMDFNFVVSVPK